jgi:hypothetical protein
VKIAFTGTVPMAHEDILRNVKLSHSLRLPFIQPVNAHERRLAIVGGGPSIHAHLDELRSMAANPEWEIWGINGACNFLRSEGIASTFFSVDPLPLVAGMTVGVEKALLCSRCDYQAITNVKKPVLFDLMLDREGGILAASSTAGTAFHLAAELGFRKVVFYGCEGCFTWSNSHAYEQSDSDGMEFNVRCGGMDYLTRPDFYVQCCEMSAIIKMFPSHFEERSGGLLRAMIQNDDHDITAGTKKLHDDLMKTSENAECFS